MADFRTAGKNLQFQTKIPGSSKVKVPGQQVLYRSLVTHSVSIATFLCPLSSTSDILDGEPTDDMTDCKMTTVPNFSPGRGWNA